MKKEIRKKQAHLVYIYIYACIYVHTHIYAHIYSVTNRLIKVIDRDQVGFVLEMQRLQYM